MKELHKRIIEALYKNPERSASTAELSRAVGTSSLGLFRACRSMERCGLINGSRPGPEHNPLWQWQATGVVRPNANGVVK